MPFRSRPLRRVLAGIDFSSGSDAVLSRIGNLPLAPGAAITLLHVLPTINGKGVARLRHETERRLRTEAAALVRSLATAGMPRAKVRPLLARGRPHEEIRRRSASADLIVLGRYGQRSFRDLLLGSTAERVLQGGTVPVLLVARRARAPYRRPLVAIDLSPATAPALDLAARLVAPGAGVLHVVHVYETANAQVLHRVGTPAARAAYARQCRTEARRAVLKRLQETDAAAMVGRVVLRRAEPRGAILETAEQQNTDLLVLGTHGRSGVADWLLGSVAEAVMRHATCDVLVVPSPRPTLVRHARASA
jgi:nucleotide-binding universal stress UspA family protein